MTKYGVEYDLKNSPFTFDYNDMTFYFSSKLHLTKFIAKSSAEIEKLNSKWLMNGIIASFENLVYLWQYTRIESRGFYIVCNGEALTSLQRLRVATGLSVVK